MSWEDRLIDELIQEDVKSRDVETWAEAYINNNGL